jgi:thioredoxin 1
MAAENVVTLTDATFDTEVTNAEQPVLIDFWAEWCGPCRMVTPIVESLAADYDGKVKVAKLNVDENPQVSRRFNIRSIPTLLLFKDGELKETAIGLRPKPQLEQLLDRYV